MVKKKKSPAKLDEELIRDHFRVAIFGSARIKKGDPTYKLIYDLAKKIAAEGIDIVTGGGPGLMDAASRGHYSVHNHRKGNNSHLIGLTIHLPREQKESYHLDIKKDFVAFSGRLDNFVHLSNVVVVAPGGVGTLLELLYVWQLVQVKHVCSIPIILVGDMWKELLKWVIKWPLKQRFLNEEDMTFFHPVRNNTQAIKIIKKKYEEYKKYGKCLDVYFTKNGKNKKH